MRHFRQTGVGEVIAMWMGGLTARLVLGSFVAALGMGITMASADELADIKQRGVLRVGTKADYRPFGFRDASGNIVGLEPDLASDMAKRLGVKLELVPVVGSNRMQFLQQGKVDLLIATMGDTPERRKVVDIVEPNYYASGANVLALKSEHIQDWTQLKGKPVCMIQGSFYNKELQESYGIQSVAFKGTTEAFAALKAGSCIGLAYDDTAVYGALLDPEWANYEVPLKSMFVQPWGVGVKLGDEGLSKFASDAIKDWHKAGTILELEKKWGLPNSKFAEEMHEKSK
jgi:polar amino acid transport system substrate-binding protein